MRARIHFPDKPDAMEFDTDEVKVTVLDSGVLYVDTLDGTLKQWYAPGAWSLYAEENFSGIDVDEILRPRGAKERFNRGE